MKAGANCSTDHLGGWPPGFDKPECCGRGDGRREAPRVRVSAKGLQLVLNAIAVGNVESLGLFERGKQLFRLRSVVAVVLQLRQKFALPGNMLLAECNVFLSLSEMPFDHCPVHSTSVAQVSLWQPERPVRSASIQITPSTRSCSNREVGPRARRLGSIMFNIQADRQ
jgi:hypothetical protein